MKLLVSKRTKTLVPDEGVRPVHARQRVLLGLEQRVRGAVVSHLHGGLGALRERGDPLQDAVLVDAEVGRLETVDVVVLAVRHLEAEHHHIDFDPEGGPLDILGAQQRWRRRRY